MNAVMTDDAQVERALKKAHITLLRNPETRLYSGAIMLGESTIVDDVPTASTNGRDKFYGREFMSKLDQPHMCGVVLHEAMHVALKHMFRHEDLLDEDHKLANASMDYVVNAVIHSLKGYGQWIKLSNGTLYDPKFIGWSVREAYNFLKQGRNKDGSQEERKEERKPKGKSEGTGDTPQPQQAQDGDKPEDNDSQDGQEDEGELTNVVIGGKRYDVTPEDEHDHDGLGEMDDAAKEALVKEVDNALQQATIMAGMLGQNIPQAIRDAMAPPIDWREVMAEFVTSATKGRDEYTWRRLDRRRLMDDIYMPDIESETIGEIVVCIDTSGSTLGPVLDTFCETLSAVAQACQPDKVRVLFWDTEVRSEQVFTDNYDNLRDRIKPVGGGGTRASCIPFHMMRNNIRPDCVLVLTDGYLESHVQWDIDSPTLWVVTENKRWTPPKGRLVHTN